MEGHFGGKIMVERPRVQWEKMIRRYARTLLVDTNWRPLTWHRNGRKEIIVEVLVRTRAEEP